MSIGGMEVFNNMLGSGVEDFNCIVQVLKEQQSLSSNDDVNLISHINTLLGQKATRTKGLLLLSTILDTSSGQHLLDKISTCVPLCIAALKSPSEQSLGYSVIKQFLERCSDIHELERSTINSYLPDLIQSLIFTKCSPQAQVHALKMLETLLHKYSKACGVHKSAIEKFLVPFVDSREKTLVVHASKCAHLLQQIRGGGEQGTNHKAAWINQCNLLLHSIVKTVSALYTTYHVDGDDEEERTTSSNVGPLQVCLEDLNRLTTLSDTADQCNPVTLKALRLSTRLQNLFVFLQAMIVEPFPVSKKFSCRQILDILMKCLSAVCGTPCASKTEPLLHCAIMNTLRALCVSLKRDILPYSTLLMRLILKTLEWSKTENNDSNQCGFKAFVNVRKAAYCSLSSLLKCVRSCKPPAQQGDLNMEDTLLENTLHDISPKTNIIQLMITNVGGLKPMNKKARRKFAMAVNAQGMPDNVGKPSTKTSWNASSIELMSAAIDSLQAIYMCMGNFLKPNSHKMVNETIVGLLYDKETPIVVKKKLSLVMSCIMDFSNTSQPSVAAHCIQLFSTMQCNASPELSWMSQHMLRSHTSSLRGYAPPLYFPTTEIATSYSTQQNLSTSLGSTINQNNQADKDDVIEVGVIDSSSDGSQDMIPESQVSITTNSKKRKRSSDGDVIEKFMDRNKSNSSISVNTLDGKRSKVALNPEESVEISDSSISEENEENKVENYNSINTKDGLQNGNINHNVQENTFLNDITDCNAQDAVPYNDRNSLSPNIRLEIVNEKNDEECFDADKEEMRDKHNDTVVSKPTQETEDEGVTIEEMMSAFVDDVNEDMK